MEPLFIAGEYVESASSRATAVENPAREEVIAEVPDAAEADIDRAVAAAKSAQRSWRLTDAYSRCELLHECAARLDANAEELAVSLTLEGGKTLKENFDEVRWSAMNFRHVAETARAQRGKVVGSTKPNQMNVVLNEPIGVVAHIMPYNYPLALLAWQMSAALATGNACVVKPAEQTPLATLKLGRILDCLPPGTFNVLTAEAEGSARLVTHPDTGMIAFTGSVATGRRVMESASGRIKKLLLELGGSDPFIVLDDADLGVAAQGAVFSAFLNAGQVCTSAERFYVQDSIYDDFLARAIELTEGVRVGDPMDEVDVGSMVSAAARAQACEAVAKLEAQGGRIVHGGLERPANLDRGHFCAPTIVEMTDASEPPREELFGPIAAVTRVAGLDDAIALANDSEYGLAASIYTSDLSTAMRAAAELECGTVWVNDPLRDNDAAAFGGSKLSGLGRELGPEGLQTFTQTKHVHIAFDQVPAPEWWFPFERPTLERADSLAAAATTGAASA
ncbi:MAG: aldehyde dehydrogenase [Actinobacteria bacterium]|nr:aldehyde dehydrogenase [Actinomycetota bacterium]